MDVGPKWFNAHGTERFMFALTATLSPLLRFWRSARDKVRTRGWGVGTDVIARRVRSAQWEYWFSGHDQWVATGQTLNAIL